MKPVALRNIRTNEEVVCDNIRAIQTIDGIEYLVVHRYGSNRTFLMRKDALEKI